MSDSTRTGSVEHDLAHDLFEQFGRLGHNMHPKMHNAVRGEMALVHVLCTEGPQTPGQIARRIRLSPARVANVLRALEEKGWIEREHSAADRRRVTVNATEAGRAEYHARCTAFESSTEEFLAKLGEDDAREAVRILRRANQILEEERNGGER
ncbi:MarR family winged helix-turn-helix transcriptional regulator [Paratractidigestivibacter sp.]|uniref:MarR family winged helix-turn-helix transcriptional regulator n=1 Tax=Paratractidigestivibacter sp. TaxID=2847316 RepID=UPI002ABD5A9B|nr:MarR family winged helix-turn-helix transcriptional regulator [Paratractidigestivibacter sp.]